MKLSCSDFTGGWTAPSSSSLVAAATAAEGASSLPLATAAAPAAPPSAQALADALGPLFEETDERPSAPFSMVSSPTAHILVGGRS